MRGEHLHHLHHRKRAGKTKGLEAYPSKKPFIKSIDKLVLMLAIIGPAVNIPQIFKIFSLQTAAGLSLFAWLAYTSMNIPWIAYGYVHKEKPILISSGLWFVTNLVIVGGIILYG